MNSNFNLKTLSKSVFAACLTLSAFGLSSANAIAATCDAQISVDFIESAPRDRFVIKNASQAGWEVTNLTISLAGSKGRMIFDTEKGGSGVEVFQPLKVENSSAKVGTIDIPKDRAQSANFTFDSFKTGENFTFSIDVDDRLSNSDLGQIRVSGSEIEGAVISATIKQNSQNSETINFKFGKSNKAFYKCS